MGTVPMRGVVMMILSMPVLHDAKAKNTTGFGLVLWLFKMVYIGGHIEMPSSLQILPLCKHYLLCSENVR
jgi:hypothetical protein